MENVPWKLWKNFRKKVCEPGNPELVKPCQLYLSDADVAGDSVANNEDRPATNDIDTPTTTETSSTATCPCCQSTFDKMSSLVAHVTTSHGRRSAVRRRVGSVSSQRPFRCYRCWKTFTVESKLRLHMLSHAENLKDFKCDVSADCDLLDDIYKPTSLVLLVYLYYYYYYYY